MRWLRRAPAQIADGWAGVWNAFEDPDSLRRSYFPGYKTSGRPDSITGNTGGWHYGRDQKKPEEPEVDCISLLPNQCACAGLSGALPSKFTPLLQSFAGKQPYSSLFPFVS